MIERYLSLNLFPYFIITSQTLAEEVLEVHIGGGSWLPILFAYSIAFCEAFSGGAYDYDNEFSVISSLFTLVNIIPNIALVTRRLHDVGRSGWWYLIVITVIGIIPFLYWVCKKGDTGPNKYGEDIEAGR